jgi:hypothetical protein
MTRAFWLSMHTPYACRDAGACCSSGWPIPLEGSRLPLVRVLRSDLSWLWPAADAPADVAGVIAVSSNGGCVFHAQGCEIQRALGPQAMPSACQHFPREVLIDRRGTFVTLSHYCPTAADLLFTQQGPLEIVERAGVLPHPGAAEGLDAREVLPPLLTDRVLMDEEGYSAWEAHMLRVLSSGDGRSPEAAVADLVKHARELQRWRPGGESLAARVASLSAGGEHHDVRTAPAPDSLDAVIRRYLAARAFASWMAYQGSGLRAVVGSVVLTLRVLRHEIAARQHRGTILTASQLKEAIRATDLRLVHQMPRDELARRASEYFAKAGKGSKAAKGAEG